MSQVGAATKFSTIQTETATILRLGTNSATRISIASTGGVTINAPTAGATLTVDGEPTIDRTSLYAISRSSSSCWAAYFQGITGGGGIVIEGSMPTAVASGQIGLGSTFSSSVGGAGGASALPATPRGYWIVNVEGTTRKIPYYDN
jgi:hypothetical protein